MEKLIVVGVGSMQRDVTCFIKRYNLAEIVGYTCNDEYYEQGKLIDGVNLYKMSELDDLFSKDEVKLFVAISHFHHLNRVRMDTFNYLKNRGWHFAKLISPDSIIYSDNIGEGTWIQEKCYIGNESIIGENNILSVGTHISHYCTIGNHNFFAGQSMLGGTVFVENQSFFGLRSTIFNNVKIGNKCIIGGNAIVNKNINDYSLVKHNDDCISIIEYSSDIIEKYHIPPQRITYINRETNNEENVNYSYDVNKLNELTEKVKGILSEKFSFIDFDKEKKIMTNQLLDSISVIDLVSCLCDEFKIDIPYNEIKPTNMENLDAISKMVYRSCYNNNESKSVVEMVHYYSKLSPNKTAIICNEICYSYAFFWNYIYNYACKLRLLGLKKNDRVIAKANQSIKYLAFYLAVHLCGGEIITLEKNTIDDRIIELIKFTNSKCIFIDKNFELYSDIIIIDSNLDVEPQTNDFDFSFPNMEDPADILFTTGTTGKSKGVELNQKAVLCGAQNMAYGTEMNKDTLLICPNPLSHSNAIKNFAACMISGATFNVLDGMTNIEAFYKAIEVADKKVSIVLPPSGIRTLFQVSRKKLIKCSYKIEYLMAATAPLLEPDRNELRKILPNSRLYNHYGCSESSTICIYDFNKYKDLIDCVGKVMPNSHVEFVDDSRNIISSSSSNLGLLSVSGGATMMGYFKEPDLTKEILVDGVVYTNDVGYMDEHGFVFIKGRNDDIINVGGLKVSPTEVEAAALSLESVSDCICISEKNDITGEALKLLVVESSKGKFDSKIAINLLSMKLDSYKVPHIYEVVDYIEKTYNGKVNRKYYRK